MSFASIASNGSIGSGNIYRMTKYTFGQSFAASFSFLTILLTAVAVSYLTNELSNVLIVILWKIFDLKFNFKT